MLFGRAFPLVGLGKQLVLFIEAHLLLAGRSLRESLSADPLGLLGGGHWGALVVGLGVLREIDWFGLLEGVSVLGEGLLFGYLEGGFGVCD